MPTPYELIVIGGGPAGLAAALSAHAKGLRRILIVERNRELGGILTQCIHSGFGLHYFQESLTGPEYAQRFADQLAGTGIAVKLQTMAIKITPQREVHVVSSQEGYQVLQAETIVLAMGCRERSRGAIRIPGDRPAGIFTAGAAQRYINIDGYMVGRRVVILGSGDIGLIMARRLTLEGAQVLACVEILPQPSGLARNIAQCLEDFHIPLYLSHTITDIQGKERVERVTVCRVDAQRRAIPGTEIVFDCDTVLLSVGLIPENELSRQAGVALDARTNGALVHANMETSLPGIFACGNVAHVHDLVDFVTAEGEVAGAAAASRVLGGTDIACSERPAGLHSPLAPTATERAAIEQLAERSALTCIICPKSCRLQVDVNGNVEGNACPRGAAYAREELKNPRRILTSTVPIRGALHRCCPVKTDAPLPKQKLFAAMRALADISLEAPVQMGQVVLENVCGSGVNVVATRNFSLHK